MHHKRSTTSSQVTCQLFLYKISRSQFTRINPKMQSNSFPFFLFLLSLFITSISTSLTPGVGSKKVESPAMSTAPNGQAGTPSGASGSGHGSNYDYTWGWGSSPGAGWGYGSGSGRSPNGFGRGFGFGFGSGSGSGSGSGYGSGGGGAHGGGHGYGSGSGNSGGGGTGGGSGGTSGFNNHAPTNTREKNHQHG